MSNGHIPTTPPLDTIQRAVAERPFVKGRQADPLDRQTLRSWSYGGLVPRQVLTSYKPREGSNILHTLKLISDRDPDMAQAIRNMLLLMGQGYEVRAYTGATDANGDQVVDEAAQGYLRALDAMIGDEYGGGMDQLVDVLNLTAIRQGAQAVEIEVTDDLQAVKDVHPVDPSDVVFKRERGTGRLMRGVMVTKGTAGADSEGFLELNPRQFRYIPVHPDVNDPYGRLPLLSALTAIFFKVELLEDLRAVVHNQGYPRLDISVLEEAVLRNVPAAYKLPGKEAELRTYVHGFLTQIKAAYEELDPTSSFIHWDSINVDYKGPPSGGVINFDILQRLLDTQIVNGLGQMNVFLNRNEGSTTTHATVQLKLFMLEVEAFQRRTKRMLEWIHNTALDLQGYASRAHVSFDTSIVIDQLLEANTLESKARAWDALVEQGLASRDEAANAILGHAAVSDGEADNDDNPDA